MWVVVTIINKIFHWVHSLVWRGVVHWTDERLAGLPSSREIIAHSHVTLRQTSYPQTVHHRATEKNRPSTDFANSAHHFPTTGRQVQQRRQTERSDSSPLGAALDYLELGGSWATTHCRHRHAALLLLTL